MGRYLKAILSCLKALVDANTDATAALKNKDLIDTLLK